MVYLICYDLEDHHRPAAYATVERIIYENATDVRKPMYSAWFVETTLLPKDWIELLSPIFDHEDSFFICEIRQPYQGWIAAEDCAWLCSRIGASST